MAVESEDVGPGRFDSLRAERGCSKKLSRSSKRYVAPIKRRMAEAQARFRGGDRKEVRASVGE